MKIISLIVIVFVLGLVGTAYACECTGSTIEQKIESAQVIFSGKLSEEIWEYPEHNIMGHFKVKKVWKGAELFPLIQTGDVKVVTAMDSGLCGVKFIPNKEYLIFAQIDGENLHTSSCSGSWFLDGRANDVKILDKIGSTHAFVDARDSKRTTIECNGPGLFYESKEQCEYEKLIREIVLPLAIAFPILGISTFIVWRKIK